MQRSRAEEEGKWDAVSKAIQKVQLGIRNCFPPLVILLMVAPQTARQDAASDGSDDAEDSAGSSSS